MTSHSASPAILTIQPRIVPFTIQLGVCCHQFIDSRTESIYTVGYYSMSGARPLLTSFVIPPDLCRVYTYRNYR